MQRVLVLALLEELVPDLADLLRDLERDLGLLADVLPVDGVLVLGVVLVHVAVRRGGLRERRVLRRELAAVRDHARLDGDVARGRLGVLDRAHDGLAADDLAEDDVLPVEVRRRIAGDEELRAVRAWASVCLSGSRVRVSIAVCARAGEGGND